MRGESLIVGYSDRWISARERLTLLSGSGSIPIHVALDRAR